MVRNVLAIALVVMIPGMAIAGTGYIPIWQHGSGVVYFNIMINSDPARFVTGSVNLIDPRVPTTYTTSKSIPPLDSWIIQSDEFVTVPSFGWGYLTSTGAAGLTYAWGAIYGTVSGKITGLTVLIPESGF